MMTDVPVQNKGHFRLRRVPTGVVPGAVHSPNKRAARYTRFGEHHGSDNH